MLVKDKTIVVTGGGNGMGRQLVLHLLSKGAKVAAVDLNATALTETEKLASNLAHNLSCHTLNITNREACEQLPQAVIDKHCQVDGVINNAGIIQPFVKIAELDYAAIERVMNVNFYGTVYLTKALLPYLLKRPEAHIMNISSMGGFLPVPGQSVYGASKAAVKLFTEGLRSELLDTSVRVTVVFPGAIATDIATNSGAVIKTGENASNSAIKLTTPQKAAEIMIAGMEKNAYRVLIGNDAKFLDILYRFKPKFASEFIYKQMKRLL